MSDYYDYNEYNRRLYDPSPEDIDKPPMSPPPLYDTSSSGVKPLLVSYSQGNTVPLTLPKIKLPVKGFIMCVFLWILLCYITISVFQVAFLYLRLPISFASYLNDFYWYMLVYWRMAANLLFELIIVHWLLMNLIPRFFLISAAVYVLDPHFIAIKEYLLFFRYLVLE